MTRRRLTWPTTLLQRLLSTTEVTETMLATLASFVCAAYSPKGIYIKTISELRWHLFCKHMAESDKLPPTIGALRQHVMRVHIQARVWGQASIALQDPQAIIKMVSCQCKTDCTSGRCSCRTQNLSCTDLCQCDSECQNDEDTQNKYETDHNNDGGDM